MTLLRRISRAAIRVLFSAAIFLAGLTPSPARAATPAHLRLGAARILTGLGAPVAIAAPNDGTKRLFVVEQRGVVIDRTSDGVKHTYLDIRGRVQYSGERGMLGLAFDPNFKTNGNFYAYYTDGNGDDHVSRFHTSSYTANSAPASSETSILKIGHSAHPNHNGGQLAFGPDGYLYVGVGDGGGPGDPGGNGQKLSVLLGKVLRIDVNCSENGKHYCIPASNPFHSTSQRGEIWEYGLRNPWRFSFDPNTRYLWIADVGEKAREEIDVASSTGKGRNYGWDCWEGTVRTSYAGNYCSGSHYGPTYQYSHASGRCAIIGGFVYRGTTYASTMGGIYIFGDYCTGEIWGFERSSNGSKLVSKVFDSSKQILTFGQDARGELYLGDSGGNVYHLTGHSR